MIILLLTPCARNHIPRDPKAIKTKKYTGDAVIDKMGSLTGGKENLLGKCFRPTQFSVV
jgi:hypothetical protein